MCKKFRFFNVVVATVACGGAGPRAVHMSDLVKLNIHCRKPAHFVVGPPAGCWQEVLNAARWPPYAPTAWLIPAATVGIARLARWATRRTRDKQG